MAVSGYRPVGWNDNEPTFTEKLRQMVQNEQWLFENTVRMTYNHEGLEVRRSEGMKIASGVKPIIVNGSSQYIVPVEFGNFFSTACNPVVVVGGVVNRNSVRCHTGARAFNLGQHINYQGFELIAAVDQTQYGDQNIMPTNFYVPWIAVGF